jgi:uncharacterized integral membrane protein (TIGR00698 family)
MTNAPARSLGTTPHQESSSAPATQRTPAILGMAAGLAICAAVAWVSTGLGRLVPIFGGPAFGIVFGMALSFLRPLRAIVRPGATFAARQILQASVVILGAQLSLRDVLRTGWTSLPVMIGTLALALVCARVFGRALGVDRDLRTLVGTGTAICGASAIAAVTRVIGAAEADVAYALSTIFAFNVVAVLSYPALAHLLGMSQHAFGLWAGTAINDTSSVVAATNIYGSAANSYGIVVKLTRTLAILPICAWLAIRTLKRSRTSGQADATRALPWLKLVPWFIGYFLLVVLANTVGAIPASWHASLSSFATFLITVALVGVGLSARVEQMRRSGARPLLLGAALWATVGLSSLALQAILPTG